MARPATGPAARLRQLEAAKERAKGLRRGERLTSLPMADLLRVRWPTLRDWCDQIDGFEQSAAYVRGGNGIEWEFDPKKTVAFLTDHFRGVLDRQAKESRRITKAVGVTLADTEAAPSLAETKDLVNLTLAVTAAQERQGHYMLASEVAGFIAGYNEAVMNGILGTRTKIDPNGNLPVATRRKVDEHLRVVAAGVHQMAAKFIEANGAGTEQGGTGRSG